MTTPLRDPRTDREERPEAVALADRFRAVRRQTEALCEPLGPEDYLLQPMTEASPVKWHLAHTSWFFETFVLRAARPEVASNHPEYGFLFNSYYNAVGERLARDRRGMISRPSVAEVFRYRAEIDAAVLDLIDDPALLDRFGPIVELGLHHEQQHQELILTDLKFALSCNPLRPAYREGAARPTGRPAPALGWLGFPEGVRAIGHDGRGFAFDNEGPRHRVFVESFAVATRPATVGEFLAFVEDGGYQRPEFWLSDGWATVGATRWTAPLNWERREDGWWTFTLGGMRRLNESEPVVHLSYYEADAFARWSKARLPTEAEWEVAVAESGAAIEGNFVESASFHPRPASAERDSDLLQLFGDVWEWTASPYVAYPGYRPAAGALGEYNGKFMCNQVVLRGGSCATPRSHIRATYRNFFPPEARWQFSGVRLARDGG